MIVYFFLLALLCALALPSDSSSRGVREWFAIVLVLLFGGLRFEVGTDWLAYKDVFEAVARGEPFNTFREENGFLAVVWASTKIGGHAAHVFLLFALTLAVKIYAFKLYRIEMNAALLIYFSAILLIYDVNGIRQGMALGFVLLAGWAAYRRRLVYFACSMALAASVHMISLVALPVYAMTRNLLYLRVPHERAALLVAGCVACYLASDAISTSVLPGYLEIFNLLDRYDHYIEEFSGAFNPLGPGSIQRILVAMVIVFSIDGIRGPRRLKALLFNAHAASLFTYFLLSFNLEFMARVSFYFKCFDLVTLSLILAAQRTAETRLLFFGFIAVLAGAQMFQILSIPDGGLIPYRNLLLP